MASRVLTNAEEMVLKGRLEPDLSLKTKYRSENSEKKPSSKQNPRVIPREEEDEYKKRWLREHFGPSIHIKTPDGMTPAEMSRQQDEMLIEIERNKIIEGVQKILKIKKQPITFKNMLKNMKDYLSSRLSLQPKLELPGSTPPKSNGGYNYRKYKYTNITKKPTKPNVLKKKPAKPKILAKKPKKKILAKNPAKPKYKKIS